MRDPGLPTPQTENIADPVGTSGAANNSRLLSIPDVPQRLLRYQTGRSGSLDEPNVSERDMSVPASRLAPVNGSCRGRSED